MVLLSREAGIREPQHTAAVLDRSPPSRHALALNPLDQRSEGAIRDGAGCAEEIDGSAVASIPVPVNKVGTDIDVHRFAYWIGLRDFESF